MATFASGRFSVVLLVLFHAFSATVATHSTVEFLPGFAGPLPFELETAYVGVGDSDEAQVFYYFVKSEGNPQTDPLLLWLSGGPGCSGLSAFAFQIGPVNFKVEPYNGSLPQLVLNPFRWTKKSSIIIVDSPVGTGFSYAKTPQALKTGDFAQVRHILQFLRKWFVRHPEFRSNPFYIGGSSYSGIITPTIVLEILDGNKHDMPFINLQGYILWSALTHRNTSRNFAVPYAHRMTLISDELFESLTTSCKGEYIHIDPRNAECLRHYDTYQKCISKVYDGCLLLPKCPTLFLEQQDLSGRRSLYNTPKVLVDPQPPFPPLACPTYKYMLAYYWANNAQVRKALHVHERSGEWRRCKTPEDYNLDIESAFPCHVNLSSRGYRSLVYSGDHDMVAVHLDAQAWIKSLNYSIVDDWRPWLITDQVAGYTRTYANKMTYATVKGGGHTAEYTRKECSVMFSRWISGESL